MPRYYTIGRSVLAKNSQDPTCENKPFCIDGRVRSNPLPDSKHSFSLFWVVDRTDDSKLVNMDTEYVEMSQNVTLKVAGKTYKQDLDADKCPSLPVLINPKLLKRGVKLVALVDQVMLDRYKKDQADMAKKHGIVIDDDDEPVKKKSKNPPKPDGKAKHPPKPDGKGPGPSKA